MEDNERVVDKILGNKAFVFGTRSVRLFLQTNSSIKSGLLVSRVFCAIAAILEHD